MKVVRNSRALRSSFLGLPVVVARAHSFIPIIPRWHTQALLAALLAKEHAWFMVLGLAAPPRALCGALATIETPRSKSLAVVVMSAFLRQNRSLKHGNGKERQK